MCLWTLTVCCLLGYLALIRGQPCADLDTHSCHLMAASKPDLCSDVALASTACPLFCNICSTTTESPTTTTMPTTTPGLPVCEDVDKTACELIHAQRPNMCSDPTLAATCPRFCHKCSIVCYDCRSISDLNQCTMKSVCGQGEVCFRYELRSLLDHSHEYKLGCTKKETCDGTNLQLIFGRNINSRDLSFSCCDGDLCNKPAPTTTTTTSTTTPKVSRCKRDIFILLDESLSMTMHENTVLTFLSNTIGQLPIGHDDALVALATFSNTAAERWGIDSHALKSDLLRSILRVSFNSGQGDVDVALRYIVDHDDAAGNRPDAPDVIFLITDGGAGNARLRDLLSAQVHQISHDVIVLEINGANLGGHVATDSYHHLLANFSTLSTTERQLEQLLCQG